jgi:hypothetical protein
MHTRRNQNGNLSEFGPAMIILVGFIVVPLLTIGFLPMRLMLSQCVLSELTYRLSHCDTRNQAYELIDTDHRWRDLLGAFGVAVSGENLRLVAATDNGTTNAVGKGEKLPPEWLPGGKFGSCIYSLELTASCSLGTPIAALTKPLIVSISTRSPWENMGRDPQSKEYFINQ